MNYNCAIVTDFVSPETDESVQYIKKILENKGFSLIEEPSQFKENYKEKSQEIKNSIESIATRIALELNSLSWSPQVLSEFPTHPIINKELEEIKKGKNKNLAMVHAYKRIAQKEDRIDEIIYTHKIPGEIQKKYGNTGVFVLSKQFKTISRNISSAEGYFNYHNVSRGFSQLGWTNQSNTKDAIRMHLSLQFAEKLGKNDKHNYLKHVINHELSHHYYDLPDHFDKRNCIMSVFSNPQIHLDIANKTNGNLFYCNSCKDKLQQNQYK